MKPPASFLQAMEEYVKEAPRDSVVRKDQVSTAFCMPFFALQSGIFFNFSRNNIC